MEIRITQQAAILVDGNNIEMSIRKKFPGSICMLNFDEIVPKLLRGRGLNRLKYFREGKTISKKLAERLHENFHGTTRPCHKSADIPITIEAMQLSDKVDAIILMSGDSDYVELVRYLKSKGVRVETCCFMDAMSPFLKDEADYSHFLQKSDLFEFKQFNRLFDDITEPQPDIPAL